MVANADEIEEELEEQNEMDGPAFKIKDDQGLQGRKNPAQDRVG